MTSLSIPIKIKTTTTMTTSIITTLNMTITLTDDNNDIENDDDHYNNVRSSVTGIYRCLLVDNTQVCEGIRWAFLEFCQRTLNLFGGMYGNIRQR